MMLPQMLSHKVYEHMAADAAAAAAAGVQASLETLLSKFWTHASFSLLGSQVFQAALDCLAAHLPFALTVGQASCPEDDCSRCP